MASDASSLKRKADDSRNHTSIHASCALCMQQFDDAQHAPRALDCDHIFCTACLKSLVRLQERRFSGKIVCPINECVTRIKRNDVSELQKVNLDTYMRQMLPLRINLRVLSGESTTLIVMQRELVGDLKKRLQSKRADFRACLQCWGIVSGDDANDVRMLDNNRMIDAYGLVNGDVVNLTFSEDFCGGLFLHTLGSRGRGDGQFRCPSGVCILPDCRLLCVSDETSNLVQLLGLPNGSHVRTLGGVGGVSVFDCPWGVCFSPDGKLLYVVDRSIVPLHVFDVSSGAHLRSFGSRFVFSPYCAVRDGGYMRFRDPRDVCVSPCGEFLFVAEYDGGRVQVVRALDGAHVRTIGSRGVCAGQLCEPTGVCLSPNGQLLLVADSGNRRVQIFSASSGVHVRTIGSRSPSSKKGRFNSPRPHRVCFSTSGEWLFVSDFGNARVQVFRVADGEHMKSFGTQGSGEGEFESTRGMCYSSDGLLFVADSAGRVHVFHG